LRIVVLGGEVVKKYRKVFAICCLLGFLGVFALAEEAESKPDEAKKPKAEGTTTAPSDKPAGEVIQTADSKTSTEQDNKDEEKPKESDVTKEKELPEIKVKGTKVEGGTYTKPEAQTATRTDTPIAETPVSIEVVPKEVIVDQGVDRLKDIVRNVSGVAPVKTEGSGIQFENTYIRGFSQRLFTAGYSFYTQPPLDMAGIEQVEVLKGPASSMYGALEPGGLINIVPKTPYFRNQDEVSAQFGSYNSYRSEFDINREISPTVAVRFAGAYENSESFREFAHKEDVFFSPSLAWYPTPDTRVTTWLWYQHLDRPQDDGVAFTSNGRPAEPISTNRAGPDHNYQWINDVVHGIQVEHDVTPDLTLREKYLMHYFDAGDDAFRVNGATSATNTYKLYLDESSFNNLEFDSATDALYRVNLGPTKHEFLIGLELNRSNYYYDRLTDSNINAISIFHPVYPSGPFQPLPGAAEQNTLTEGVAGYLQDQMDALDNKLHLMLSGRADFVYQYNVAWQTPDTITSSKDLGFSGRAGLLYDVTSWVSPYADICRSFNPNGPSTTTFDGSHLKPTTGLQYEGGLKFSFMDKRLTVTSAAYQITKDNVAVGDPDHSGFSLNGGTLRSRGIELDALGQITRGLQVIGNYAHTGTEVIQSTTLPVGAPFAGIPVNSGSLWLKYTIQEGRAKGLGFGSGIFAASTKSGDNNHDFDLPGYAEWEAGLFYTRTLKSGHQLKVQFNAFNILDKTYYESSGSTGSVQPGAPRSFMGRIGFTF
jgi:iron complex outermembrane receptor protein